MVEELIRCFLTDNQATLGHLTEEELTAARDLATDKYASPQWIDRL